MMIYIFRHAWAEEPDQVRWPDDSQRPLTPEGRKRFRRFARRLLRRDIHLGMIGSSPYLRCLETAEILIAESRDSVVVEAVPALAPQGHPEEVLSWIKDRIHQFQGNVTLVGHSPDVEQLVSLLIGGGQIKFNKGALAAIEFNELPQFGSGRLVYLVPAPLLKC